MPSALTLGGLLVALTLHADGPLQPPAYTATVKVPETLVRSGPSDDPKMYATNRLRQGAIVEVVGERDGGWLAIKPPSGSFDWINTRFLHRIDLWRWVVVTHDDSPAPVLLGSGLNEDKPTVIGSRAVRGSIMVAFGLPIADKKDNDGMFLPIDPPPGEVRFIRADAVERNRPAEQAAAPPPTTALSGPPAPGGTAAPAAVAGGFRVPEAAAPTTAAAPLPAAVGDSSDPLWAEAQQLEKDGRTAEAAQKYTELARKVCSENHDLAMQCYNRAYFLREPARGGAAPTGQPTTAGDSRLHPVAAGTYGQQVGYQTPAPPQTQQSNYQSNPDPAAVGPLMRSDPGQLRLAGRGVDGKRTYYLRSSQGQLLMYVTAQPGVDLESYLDHNVQVTGPLVYRMDLRAYHMSAQQVSPLQ